MNDNKGLPFCLFGIPENGKRVTWEVTNVCNFLCKHCCTSSSAAKSPDELNLEQFHQALDDMADFGVTEIYFSGGEPFARPDMLDIIARAKKHHIQLCVATNGSLIRPTIAERLKNLGVEKIHVSLDDYRATQFNYFRGGEYYNDVVTGIKILKASGIYTRVGCVIWSQNVQYLEDMVKFSIGLGVNQLALNWLLGVGRITQNPQVMVPRELFSKTTTEIARLRDKYGSRIKISMLRDRPFEHAAGICPAGTRLFHVDHKGHVSTCSWVYKMDKLFSTDETLKTHSFRELVNMEKMNSWRSMTVERTEKHGPGCPAVCYQDYQQYMVSDPLYQVPQHQTL